MEPAYVEHNEYYKVPNTIRLYITKEGVAALIIGVSCHILHLSPNTDTNGYTYIWYNRKRLLLHRVLALTFIPNPENLPIVRHLSDVKRDNRLDNLAWGTRKQNTRDMVDNGHSTKGVNNHWHKLNEEQVLAIRREYKWKKNSQILADKYKVTTMTICDIATRRTWRHIP